jgi:hypothetical protein
MLRVFLGATVFLEAPERPGIMIVPTPRGPVTPVFSELSLLAQERGAVAWFATTGTDLLAMAPDADFLLDPGTDHAVILRTGALRRAVRVEHNGSGQARG